MNLQKTSSKKALKNRIETNRYAKKDFDLWVESILDSIKFGNVLDLCCGTGKQIKLYNKRQALNAIIGVDISTESLQELSPIISRRVSLIEADMDEVLDKELKGYRFDLISCFYGLYYSKKPTLLLTKMIEHLEKDGGLLIVGPHGNNNKSFYDLLAYKLPKSALEASKTFMYDILKVLCYLGMKSIIIKTFVNNIIVSTKEDLLKYWQSTLYYDKNQEKGVLDRVERYYQEHNDFVIEKHIMAIIANS